MTRVLRELRDIVSYCGLGFLVVYGFQTAFAYPGITLIRQHRWLGCLILLSVFAIGSRLNVARKAGF